jgi:hypothetical protein
MSALFPAFFFTVALLVTTAYFLMGGLPLLILQHDTPVDARFIRGFFNIYYRAAFGTAVGAAASYAWLGWWGFAAGTAAIALGVGLLRRRLIPAMEQLSSQIQTGDEAARARFRRVHGAALAVNLVQLVALVWGLTRISL